MLRSLLTVINLVVASNKISCLYIGYMFQLVMGI